MTPEDKQRYLDLKDTLTYTLQTIKSKRHSLKIKWEEGHTVIVPPLEYFLTVYGRFISGDYIKITYPTGWVGSMDYLTGKPAIVQWCDIGDNIIELRSTSGDISEYTYTFLLSDFLIPIRYITQCLNLPPSILNAYNRR